MGLLASPFANDLGVVSGNDVPQVGHCPVADLDRLAIQHLLAGVARQKALVQDLHSPQSLQSLHILHSLHSLHSMHI